MLTANLCLLPNFNEVPHLSRERKKKYFSFSKLWTHKQHLRLLFLLPSLFLVSQNSLPVGPISFLPWVPAASETELPLVTRRKRNKTSCTRTVCLDEDRQAWGGIKKVFPPPPCPDRKGWLQALGFWERGKAASKLPCHLPGEENRKALRAADLFRNQGFLWICLSGIRVVAGSQVSATASERLEAATANSVYIPWIRGCGFSKDP